MEFLQDIARELAKRGKWLQWPTTTGFPLINLYEEPQYKIIESKLRGVRVRRKIAVGNKPIVSVGKSKNAVAANVIHSLDASHMMLTAIACKRAGIDLMGIHDCYVCLAPQAERLDDIVRQELVQMYDGRDYLTEIRDVALQIAAGEKKRPTKMTEALSHHPLAPKGRRVAAAVGTETPKFRDVPKLGSFDLHEILRNVYLFSP
jgi:DNA-directed RNA polymerase